MGKRGSNPPVLENEAAVVAIDVRAGWLADGSRITLWVRKNRDEAYLILMKPEVAGMALKGFQTAIRQAQVAARASKTPIARGHRFKS